MECNGKGVTPSRAFPSPKGNKSFRRASTFFRSRRNLISAMSNGFLIQSTIQMFALALFVTVLLAHIRMQEKVTKLNSCFRLCKKTFLLNGSLSSQTLAIASASEHSERKLRYSVTVNLDKPGFVPFFHVILILSLENHQGWIRNEHKHSINPPLNATSISWRRSSRSTRSPLENIYNMDEKGVQRGGGRKAQARKFLVPRSKHPKYKLRSANLELVTIVDCVAADGAYLSPAIIFEGKQQYERAWFDVDPKIS
jgi:hypothetical protein